MSFPTWYLNDNQFMYYDGHAGYDYPLGPASVAAESGVLCLSRPALVMMAVVLGVVPKSVRTMTTSTRHRRMDGSRAVQLPRRHRGRSRR